MRNNEIIIKLLDELNDLMIKKGEGMRARAYQRAQETIMFIKEDIIDAKQIKGKPGIGPTIFLKLETYLQTGKLSILERERENPQIILADIFGIGPKKAIELVEQGITSIEELKKNLDKLNTIQKIGLKFYEDIKQRIPKTEIIEFKKDFGEIFKEIAPLNSNFEIVGSFRRGAETSGDIDIIISNKDDNIMAFDNIIKELVKRKKIIHILSKGISKSMTLMDLGDNKPKRRVDFLWAPKEEYPFAILYFTGSKIFNTVMRQRALDKGLSLNEHGFFRISKGQKGEKISDKFENEKDIFDFLDMEYKHPNERIDARSVVDYEKKENTLSKLLNKANEEYYLGDNPILTDEEYDKIRDYVRSKFPKNEIAKDAHRTIKMDLVKNKVELPYEMFSMDKIKDNKKELENWKSNFNGDYILSCKLDGASGLYTTEGKEPKLYTRGNGTIGQDVSHLIPYLKLPKTKGITIRGEFVIEKEKFDKKYKGEFAKARNFVVGVINQKKIEGIEKFLDIDFVAYEVIVPILTPEKQLEFLEKENVMVVEYKIQNDINIENLTEVLKDWRRNYNYEIDGVVVVDNKIYPRLPQNPEYAFAFKIMLNDQIEEATVIDVLWTPSKDGILKPRVQIVPTLIGGATIEYITGYNAKFIEEKKIGIGAKIKVVKSGDIIPNILEVIIPSEKGKLPLIDFEWNETKVDILIKNIDDDMIVREKIITKFFKVIGVEGLSNGIVKKFMKIGAISVEDIIALKREDYYKIEGFKEKLTKKIYEGIHNKIKEATLPELMMASNCFGFGMGEKLFIRILSSYPDILEEKDVYRMKRKLLGINGIGEKIVARFIENYPKFIDFMKRSNLEIIAVKEEKINTDHILYNKKIVFSGFRPKEVMLEVKKFGGDIVGSVSKNTDLIVVKDLLETTGKVDIAKKNGVELITIEEFINKFLK